MARTQATGTEILNDSLTGDDISEETLVDTLIPFLEAGFSAANIHAAILEAAKKFNENKILTGYDEFNVLTDCKGNVLVGEE